MKILIERKYFRLFFIFYVFLNTLCLGYFGIQRNILFIPIFLWGISIITYELLKKKLFYKQSHLGLIGLYGVILCIATYMNKQYSNSTSYLILGMQLLIFLLLFSNPKGTKLIDVKKEMRMIIPFTSILTFITTVISLLMFFINFTSIRNGFTIGLVGDRLFGIYFNCNPAAFLACMMMVFSIIAIKAKYRFPYFYYINFAAQFLYIILSGCRAALIIVAIMAIILLYFKIFREHGFSRVKQIGVSSIVCICILFGSTIIQKTLFVIPQLQGAVVNEEGNRFKLDKIVEIIRLVQEGKSSNLRKIYDLSDEVSSGRLELFKTSLKVFKSNPLQGVGVNNFQRMGIALNPNDYVVKQPQVVHTHNVFVETLVIGGIFGFLVFFLFFLKSTAIIWETLKRYVNRSSYFIVLCFMLVVLCDFIGGMFDYGVFYVYSLSSTLSWLFLGYIYWLSDHPVMHLTSDSKCYDFKSYQLCKVNYVKEENEVLNKVYLEISNSQLSVEDYQLDIIIHLRFSKSNASFVYRSQFVLYESFDEQQMMRLMAFEIYEMVYQEITILISDGDELIELPISNLKVINI